MGKRCFLCGKNREQTLSLHKFPKDRKTCRTWINICGLSEETDDVSCLLICGMHFAPEDYVNFNAKLHGARQLSLKRGAVPSLSVPNPMNQLVSSLFSSPSVMGSETITVTQVPSQQDVCNQSLAISDTTLEEPPQESIANKSEVRLVSTFANTSEELMSRIAVTPQFLIQHDVQSLEKKNYESIIVNAGMESPYRNQLPSVTNASAHPVVKNEACIELNADVSVSISNSTTKSVGNASTATKRKSTELHVPPQTHKIACTDPSLTNEASVEPDVDVAVNNMGYCSTPPRRTRKFAEPRFVTEIETPDVATPEKARRILSLVRQTDAVKQKKIKSLQDKNRYLLKRVASLKELVTHLSKKGLMSEEAEDTLLVYIHSICSQRA